MKATTKATTNSAAIIARYHGTRWLSRVQSRPEIPPSTRVATATVALLKALSTGE